MTLNVSQDNRIGRLHTPLAKDDLVLLRLSGSDGINELFDYRVEALGVRPDLDFDALVGKLMGVELTSLDGDPIHFTGIVVEARFKGVGETGNLYVFQLRPWFWLAGRARQQRIFHEKSIPAILTEVMEAYSSASANHLVDSLTASYEPREYVVQYGESDLDFCQRLMERYGINYHFTHTRNGHSLILTDSNDEFAAIPGGRRNHVMVEDRHVDDKEHFWSWSPRRLLTTGAVRLTDYNFKTPTTDLTETQAGTAGHSFGDLEAFDYPGLYETGGAGKTMSSIRLEQERSADYRQSAEGDTMTLKSGMVVGIVSDSDATINSKKFLCLRAHHDYTSESYGSGDQGETVAYRGRYEFYPEEKPFRPALRTAPARVAGPQTAMVVGKTGEEIDVDPTGRILVRFHWDLAGANSMRCRVAQLWASKSWGAQFIPRIGMEVVVEFLEGDPDKPLVTGCVYHGNHPMPYSPEDEKNRSGIKSNSTPNSRGYNEVMFDDTAGKELFRQHAQFDMETKVLNDERREIDKNRSTIIGVDESHEVKGDSKWEITGQETRTTTGDRSVTMKANDKVEVKNNRDTKVAQNDTLETGMELKISAGTKIELKCGASKITMTPGSITIEALSIDVKATASLTTSGLTAEHTGSALQTIKGGLVKIN